MPVCIVVIALILMMLAVLLFIPCSFRARADIKDPFHANIHVEWLNDGFYYDWDYVFGQPAVTTICTGWKQHGKHDEAADGAAVMDEESPAAPETAEENEISDETLQQAVTGDDLHAEEGDNSFWWKPYVWNEDFLGEIAHFFLQLLHHSRIRTVTVTGSLGIGEPHQTGMLAGFLYMVMPAAVSTLNFNYLEEEYDCQMEAAGRLYPGAVLLDLASCMLSRPVRQLIFAMKQRRKELAHG